MSGAWNPRLPIGPHSWALETVIERQEAWLARWSAVQVPKRPRPPKYLIKSLRTASGWSYYWELSPCPACNPPQGFLDNFAGLARETFGTVWWCRPHQKFWDSFDNQYSHVFMLAPASTKPVTFPSS